MLITLLDPDGSIGAVILDNFKAAFANGGKSLLAAFYKREGDGSSDDKSFWFPIDGLSMSQRAKTIVAADFQITNFRRGLAE